MQFETSSRKQYEVGEFYSHFKTCLPKIAMISNGVRGHSNDDTFDRGEVVAIVSNNHDGLTTIPKGSYEPPASTHCDYVEAYFIVDGAISGGSIHLPIDLKELRIVEVTGIKGQDKEQWKIYQQKIKRQLLKPEETVASVGKAYGPWNQKSSTEPYAFKTRKERRRVQTPTETKEVHAQKEPSLVTLPVGKSQLNEVYTDAASCNSTQITVPAVGQNLTMQGSLISQLTKELERFRHGRSRTISEDQTKVTDHKVPSMKVAPIQRAPTQHYKNLEDLRNNYTDQLYQNQERNEDKIYVNTDTEANRDVNRCNMTPCQVNTYAETKGYVNRCNIAPCQVNMDAETKGYVNRCNMTPCKVYENSLLKQAGSDGNHKNRYEAHDQQTAEQSTQDLVEVYSIARIPILCEAGSSHLQSAYANRSRKKLTVEEIKQLTIEDVSDYLVILQLHDYVEVFANNQIDGLLLTELDEAILVSDFKMRKFEAKKLRNFSKEGRLPATRGSSPAYNK